MAFKFRAKHVVFVRRTIIRYIAGLKFILSYFSCFLNFEMKRGAVINNTKKTCNSAVSAVDMFPTLVSVQIK